MNKSLGQQMLDIIRIVLFLFTGAFYISQLISWNINTDFWPSLFCFLFMVWFDIACGIKDDIHHSKTRIMVALELTISVLIMVIIIILNGSTFMSKIPLIAVIGILSLFCIKAFRFVMSLTSFIRGDSLRSINIVNN